MRPRVDVAIAGGGPAGSALAILLRRAGATVVVFERSEYDTARIGETVPGRIVPLLAKLGVREAFDAENHAPAAATMSCWGSDEPFDRPSIFDPYGGGWHLDRRRFDAMLARAAENAGAVVLRGTPSRAHDAGADLVVDATGRPAALARARGRRKIALDRLVGIVALGEGTLDGRTVIEAARDGWWYSASLPGGRAVFAWMTDADLVSGDAWRAALESAPLTQQRAEAFEPRSMRMVSAASHCLDAVCDDRWLAVGDAALALDPLSGQGICKALESSIAAASAIVAGRLHEYARWHAEELRAYVLERVKHYGLEQRWPAAPFWNRRHQILVRRDGKTSPVAIHS
ncbi:MAG TPA: FAD-dependent monooxygenase [Vicinamibacterales bacterium]